MSTVISEVVARNVRYPTSRTLDIEIKPASLDAHAYARGAAWRQAESGR